MLRRPRRLAISFALASALAALVALAERAAAIPAYSVRSYARVRSAPPNRQARRARPLVRVRVAPAEGGSLSFVLRGNSLLAPVGSARTDQPVPNRQASPGWREFLLGPERLELIADGRVVATVWAHAAEHRVWTPGSDRYAVLVDVRPREQWTAVSIGDVTLRLGEQAFAFFAHTLYTRSQVTLARTVPLALDGGNWQQAAASYLRSGDFPAQGSALADLAHQMDGADTREVVGGVSVLTLRSADGDSFARLARSGLDLPALELQVGSIIEEGERHSFGALEIESIDSDRGGSDSSGSGSGGSSE